MDRTTLEQDAPPGAGIVPMSLAGTCPGLLIERGPKRGHMLAFCEYSCGAFDPAGTLKPAAVRLPPAMEWGCVNWRGHAATVRHHTNGPAPLDLGNGVGARGGEASDSEHARGVMPTGVGS